MVTRSAGVQPADEPIASGICQAAVPGADHDSSGAQRPQRAAVADRLADELAADLPGGDLQGALAGAGADRQHHAVGRAGAGHAVALIEHTTVRAAWRSSRFIASSPMRMPTGRNEPKPPCTRVRSRPILRRPRGRRPAAAAQQQNADQGRHGPGRSGGTQPSQNTPTARTANRGSGMSDWMLPNLPRKRCRSGGSRRGT